MKHSLNDTIAAIATPQGSAGVGVIRVSGSQANKILLAIFKPAKNTTISSHKMLLGEIVDCRKKQPLDQAMACYMKQPKSYTGEDVVEFFCHGSPALLESILKLIINNGARLAKAGEFTKRAYLNQKIDLSQAEAVLDLVSAKSSSGAGLSLQQLKGGLSGRVGRLKKELVALLAELEARLDFDEDMPSFNPKAFALAISRSVASIDKVLSGAQYCRLFVAGVSAVIVGRPNVGKSSLLNSMLGADRAIVTSEAGTTRDTLEEVINIKGIPLKVVDTAGIRHPKGEAEKAGVGRTKRELSLSDLVIVVLDGSEKMSRADKKIVKDVASKQGIIVINKSDLKQKIKMKDIIKLAGSFPVVSLSSLYRKGVRELFNKLYRLIVGANFSPKSDAIYLNARHEEILRRAKLSLEKVLVGIKKKWEIELLSIDLKHAILALGEVSGEAVSEEVIDYIFGQFCVGK